MIQEKKSVLSECPACGKKYLFKDEIDEHCLWEHGHTLPYLRGYHDARQLVESRDKKLFAEPTEYEESINQRTERLRIKKLAEKDYEK